MELLAPAGNLDIFKSVIGAGADAVYFGGDLFGARAFAENFTPDEGKEAIRYAHLYGKKAYLTINTLLKNREMEQMLFDYAKHYYEAGVDAVIVQDIGVFSFITQYFPDLPIHASTQMTITNEHGAKWIQEMGASRVVTSREISFSEIRDIYDRTHMEIETFVHGALCMGYSGQCLMSSMIGGRSGNRGRCAQPCRLPYELYDGDGNRCPMPGGYLLSPKDLCGIEDIKALSDAGVYSFKIEGRMKQIAYATGVVSVYRGYMDAFLEGKDVTVSKHDKQKLYDFGNRCGFTNDYFRKQNSKEMITYRKPSHEKKDSHVVASDRKVLVQGTFIAEMGKPMRLLLETPEGISVTCEGGVVESAINNPTMVEHIKNQLEKTGNTPFSFRELAIKAEENIFIPVAHINELRREALSRLREKLECAGNRIYQGRKPVFYSAVKNEDICPKEVMVCCNTKEQFDVVCNKNYVDAVAISFENMLLKIDGQDAILYYLHAAKRMEKAFYICLPAICRKRVMDVLQQYGNIFADERVDGVLAGSMDALGFLQSISYPKEKIRLDYRFYTFSNIALEAMRNQGYRNFCAPLELNHKELAHRYNGDSQMLLYGLIPLMLTANCQNQNCHGCNHKETILFLQDRRHERFPVKNVCAFCYNEIYNSKIYYILTERDILEKLCFRGYRMDFTLENDRETENILKQFEEIFVGTKNDRKDTDSNAIVTKGHFKRGVE